jgi:ubiquinone/menaquinone biosynthesis C-methylase UbiE
MIDAETYDSYVVPAIFEPWSRDLIKRAKVWKGDRVLDVATGTGIVACRIAATGAQVTGLDIDPKRLDRARARASDEGVGVKWIEGTAESLPFRQPAFDLVTCQQGLQFVPDRALACREMRRVIAPGGRAVIAAWCAIDQQGPYHAIDELAARRSGKRYVTPFSLTDAKVLEGLLADAKFFAIAVEVASRQVRVPDPARFAQTTLHSILDEPPSEDAVAEGVTALAPWTEGDQLVFGLKSLLAVGRVKT